MAYGKDNFDLWLLDNPKYSQEERELIIEATEEYEKLQRTFKANKKFIESGKTEYIVLQRNFGQRGFSLHNITADSEEKAWEIVENEITGNMTQEWLLTKEEMKELIILLQKGIK